MTVTVPLLVSALLALPPNITVDLIDLLDRSSKMRTDDLESAFAILRVSVTESSAVSVEWPLLKPDCLDCCFVKEAMRPG